MFPCKRSFSALLPFHADSIARAGASIISSPASAALALSQSFEDRAACLVVACPRDGHGRPECRPGFHQPPGEDLPQAVQGEPLPIRIFVSGPGGIKPAAEHGGEALL
jgi:hypothetical protein